MSFVCRQPNGRLIRFSSIIDCPTHYQMTEDDYIELCAEEARKDARRNLKMDRFIKPFDMVTTYFTEDNMTREELNQILKECSEPYEGEMIET